LDLNDGYAEEENEKMDSELEEELFKEIGGLK
jgi:hypothetical protein